MGLAYDYIIVGAGTAGCTLANRLSADGRFTVALLEAGGDDRHWVLQMPAGLRSVFKPGSRFNWWFETTPQPHLEGRRVQQPRGKVLGGSSSINGMTFLRGNPLDYDQWASELGCAGWSYAECLPYFKRSESCPDGDPRYRGRSGPVGVQQQRHLGALDEAFLTAGQQAGHELVTDVNACHQAGVARFDMSVAGGMRSSAARAHLHLQPKRDNLAIWRRTWAVRLIFTDDAISGVECLHEGQHQRMYARREVILSAGAFGSPALLLRSGIGPAQHLQACGLTVHRDRPEVGANLQDHIETHIQVETDQPVSLNRELAPHRMLWAGLEWLIARRGVAAANHCRVGAFLRSGVDDTRPDLQIHFFPVFFGANWLPERRRYGYRLGVGPLRPTSRGQLRLDPNDPGSALLIDPNYLATDKDRDTIRAGVKMGRDILAQSAMQTFAKQEVEPGAAAVSDTAIDAFIRRDAASAYHPCGTCRMGSDQASVVDTSLRLRGMAGLRIVDASVIPRLPSANINACVFMIAEKISEQILGCDISPDIFY